MTITNLYTGGWASNCYYLVDKTGTYALVVDPSVSPSHLSSLFPEQVPQLVGIILTHAHYDHMLCLLEWTKGGDIPVYVGEGDVQGLSSPVYNVSGTVFGTPTVYSVNAYPVKDGDVIPLGGEQMRVIATPGHTKGGISLLGDGFVLTGDTLFAQGGVGRCDLPGSSFMDLQTSVRRLLDLPPHIQILPGHGATSTIGRERKAQYI